MGFGHEVHTFKPIPAFFNDVQSAFEESLLL
jgi:hypothetical protein